MPGAASPFQPQRFEFCGRSESKREVIDLALAVLGGGTEPGLGQDPLGRVLPVGASADGGIAGLSDGVPLLVLPESEAREDVERAVAVFNDLAGEAVALGDGRPCSEFSFASGPDLWPFSGSALSESRARRVCASRSPATAETLVECVDGGVFLRGTGAARTVYLSLVPLPEPGDARLLKDEFCSRRFMGLLPLLAFARTVLGEAGWRSPRLSASFLVDDPNLRFRRYGFLSLEAVIEAARDEDLHLSIAMIPLDYRKTRTRAAELIRRNPEALSVVFHGVDHTKSEFEADVRPEQAEAKLTQAIARMDEHRRRTGVQHASVMTFPHGDCNSTWLQAMRNSGFHAALASRAIPFAHDTGLDNPLYELHPAELGFAGFPVVNRFKCEDPVEQLLFQAWLGKPLIVYSHHDDFDQGLDDAIRIARHLNRQVRPLWRDIGALIAENYQQRTVAGTTVARVFSNRVRLAAELGATAVLKPAREVPGDESCSIGGLPAPIATLPEGPAILDLGSAGRAMDVSFGPPPVSRQVAVHRMSARSRLRRAVTELRDQGAPILSRLRGVS